MSLKNMASSLLHRGRVFSLAADLFHLQRRVISTQVAASKKLFTPGPLNCSGSVKSAMLQDLGSRDITFIDTLRFIRRKLIEIAGVSGDFYTAVPLQGSGTYAVEAVINTSTPKSDGKVLVLSNGAYGKRIHSICKVAAIDVHTLSFPEVEAVDVVTVEQHLRSVQPSTYSTVALVHCETSSGIVNSVQQIGQLVHKYQTRASYFVDAMSSFGAIAVNLDTSHIDFLVSSANKCLEGVPGFAFVIAKTERLLACQGNSRSLCLDLVDQYLALKAGGQFRFTPPTHVMLAFQQALKEFEQEGGVLRRGERYANNQDILRKGMQQLGFEELLRSPAHGCIITAFCYPKHPNFSFEQFYQRLANLGQIIYPGKVTNADCFRIGNIGQLFPADMHHLLKCIQQVCKDMAIPLPLTQ